MGKFLLILILLVALVMGGGLVASNLLLEIASQKGLEFLQEIGKTYGIELTQPRFLAVKRIGFRALSWEKLKVEVQVFKGKTFDTDRKFSLQISDAILGLKNFERRTLGLEVKGLEILAAESPKGPRDQLIGEELQAELQLSSWSPKKAFSEVREFLIELARLFIDGKSQRPVQFSGISTFVIGMNPVMAKVWAEKRGGESSLIMDRKDLRAISAELQEKLTEREVDLLSEYPLRAPKLLRIREKAQSTSKQAHEKDPRVPEDAYQHVLWSYLLTVTYGEKFAQQVTDAHEFGAVGNTEADLKMDLNNNEVGRRYARAGYPESEILERLLKDPNVIHSAEPEPIDLPQILTSAEPPQVVQ